MKNGTTTVTFLLIYYHLRSALPCGTMPDCRSRVQIIWRQIIHKTNLIRFAVADVNRQRTSVISGRCYDVITTRLCFIVRYLRVFIIAIIITSTIQSINQSIHPSFNQSVGFKWFW